MKFIAEVICIEGITLFGEISMQIQFSFVFTINTVFSIISKVYRRKIFIVIIFIVCSFVYTFVYCLNLGQPNSTFGWYYSQYETTTSGFITI